MLTENLIRLINARALKSNSSIPSQYRTSEVIAGRYHTPHSSVVPTLMKAFTRQYTEKWEDDPYTLCAWTMWSLGFIHPFIDGNGRTLDRVGYLTLCMKYRRWIFPFCEFSSAINENHKIYTGVLAYGTDTYYEGKLDLAPTVEFLQDLCLRIMMISNMKI